MTAYTAPIEGRASFKRFDFNESTVGPSPKVKKALIDFVTSERINTYPHDYSLLHKKIAEYIGVAENNIRITDGADGAIEAIAFSCLEKDDEVIIPTPSFGMFYIPPAIQDASIIKPEYGKNMEFPTDAVLEKITNKTKLIIICNPNNPTGTLIKKEDIVRILDKAKNAFVMIDEVYGEFTGKTCADLITKYSNLFIIRSFSKAFAMASLRVGYIITNVLNISEINKVVAPYNVNQFAVVGALAALDDLEYMKNYVDEVVNKSKPLLETFLNTNMIKYYPGAANYLLIEVENPDDMYNRFKNEGYLIRPQRGILSKCVRVSIGTLKETEDLIKVFEKIIKK